MLSVLQCRTSQSSLCLLHVLQCVAVSCSVLQYVVVCCSVLLCVAVCCSVLQCVAVFCSVLQMCCRCVALCLSRKARVYLVNLCVLHCVAGVLQCVANLIHISKSCRTQVKEGRGSVV